MTKAKYVAFLAVAVLLVSVITVWGFNIGGDMPDPADDERYPILQTNDPPVIDGNVQVGVTWPEESFMGHIYIAQQGGGIPTGDVYMIFDNLAGYQKVDNDPAGYGPEDWTGYYLYIGVKATGDYAIHDDGNWLVIDWDQDDVIDFADHNGNSAGKGKKQGYATQYSWSPEGVEWAIPYIDEFDGICQSPFSIMVHIEIELPGGGTETTTFPDRPPGHFLSIEICPWELISPEEPPEPGDWGIRTIGFWKHQLNIAVGAHKGHQHVPSETLRSYLTYISAESTVEELQDMDTNMMEALALLELHGKHPMRDRAIQQLLAVWLNYVSGNEVADLDGVEYHLYDDVIVPTEAAINAGDPDLEYWKDLCDAINNSGDE